MSLAHDAWPKLGIVVPYNVIPGDRVRPARIPDFTKTSWDAYQWNPPEFLSGEFPDPDPAASPKPSWSTVLKAARMGELIHLADRVAISLRDEAARRITAAYGETDFRGEMELRLRGGHTPAQDAARERLRARYKALTARVRTMSLTELEAFDPYADAHWGKPS